MAGRGRWCRTKIGQAFFVIIMIASAVFVTNFVYGLVADEKHKQVAAKLPDQRVHGHRVKGRRRMRADSEMVQICRHPPLSLSHDANKALFHLLPALKCDGSDMLYLKDGAVHVNQSRINGRSLSHCDYRAIIRKNDNFHLYSKVHSRTKRFKIMIKHDFFRIQCFFKSRKIVRKDERLHNDDKGNNKYKRNNSWLKTDKNMNKEKEVYDEVREVDEDVGSIDAPDIDQFFAQIYPLAEVFNRSRVLMKDIKNSISSTGSGDCRNNMNIMIVILDSMSHLNYQRKLPNTYKYLKNKLNSIIMNGFNKVADGSTANIVPLITGKFIDELPETRRGHRENRNYVDSMPLIWNRFENKGYVTMYAEDEPNFGNFNSRLNGFEEQPVDHYMHPFWQAVYDSTLNKKSQRFCIGEKPKHQYLLDYAREFFSAYAKIPKFGLIFSSELSRNEKNAIQYIDDDLKEFLSKLYNKGDLADTLLIVMSDHGGYFELAPDTLQGKLEERLPFLSMTFPRWFQKEYPTLIKNVRHNSNRLVTPFDIHDTLVDIVDNKCDKISQIVKTRRSTSLFRPVPLNRTCSSADIGIHWCTCMIAGDVENNDDGVLLSAKAAVKYINLRLKDHLDKCAKLSLDNVMTAQILVPNEKVIGKNSRNIINHRLSNLSKAIDFEQIFYQVTIKTRPNNGLFEVTVLYTKSTGVYTVTPDISRINQNDSQANCVLQDYPDLINFCYCKV